MSVILLSLYFSFTLHAQEVRVQVEPLHPYCVTYDCNTVRTDRKDINVLRLPMDAYLKVVLPSEVPVSWPIEALKAQVVAARSYLWYQMQENKNQAYDVQSTVMDQVFDIKKYKILPKALSDKVDVALKSTAHIALMDKNDNVVKAYFHSHCGGHTEMPQNVWNFKVPWSTRKDEFCSIGQAGIWQFKTDLRALSLSLKKKHSKQADLKQILQGIKNSSDRIDSLFFIFSDSSVLRMTSQDIRAMLGFDKVKSANYQVKILGDQVLFQGKGYGHGVGLCQMGSRKMAQVGKSFQEILSYYYPHAKLGNLPSKPLLQSKVD